MKYHNGFDVNDSTLEDEIDINNALINVDLLKRKTTNIPKVLGMISFVISLVSVPYAYFVSSLLVAMDRGYKSGEILDILDKKSPYVIAPIVFSILIAILITFIGIGVFVLSLLSLRYFKISYIGFLICSSLYLLLIIPSKGASLLQFILCLIAGLIGLRNYKKCKL